MAGATPLGWNCGGSAPVYGRRGIAEKLFCGIWGRNCVGMPLGMGGLSGPAPMPVVGTDGTLGCAAGGPTSPGGPVMPVVGGPL
jgi:hypothetical protein